MSGSRIFLSTLLIIGLMITGVRSETIPAYKFELAVDEAAKQIGGALDMTMAEHVPASETSTDMRRLKECSILNKSSIRLIYENKDKTYLLITAHEQDSIIKLYMGSGCKNLVEFSPIEAILLSSAAQSAIKKIPRDDAQKYIRPIKEAIDHSDSNTKLTHTKSKVYQTEKGFVIFRFQETSKEASIEVTDHSRKMLYNEIVQANN